MSTPHIAAEKGDFAKTVLMPGDPYRSALIAESFLSEARLVNDVRGVRGYTGLYKGVPVSVGVENIIRVGSAGSYSRNVKVRDIVIAMGACTDSAYASQFNLPGTFAPVADFNLLETAVKKARELKFNFHVGNVISSDRFYGDSADLPIAEQPQSLWGKMGVLAVEMEAAALYMNAARAGKKALAVCTVSDSLITGEALSSKERQNSFTDMIRLSLETAAEL